MVSDPALLPYIEENVGYPLEEGRFRIRRLFYNALLKHDVGVQSLLSGGNDAVHGPGLLIELEPLIVADAVGASFVVLCDDFLYSSQMGVSTLSPGITSIR